VNYSGHYTGDCMDSQCRDSTWDHDCPTPPAGWRPHGMFLFVGGALHAAVQRVDLVAEKVVELTLKPDQLEPPPTWQKRPTGTWWPPASHVNLASAETYMMREVDIGYLEDGQPVQYRLPVYVALDIEPPDFPQAISMACMSYTARTLGHRSALSAPNGAYRQQYPNQ
jgi:hypothetical protein